MAILTGEGGAVHKDTVPVSSVGKWSISEQADQKAVVTSGGDGAPTRVAMNKDWSGQYSAQGHTPIVLPKDSFEFKGSIDGVNGVTGDVRCNQVEIVVDIESGEPIVHTVSFEGNGALAIGLQAAADTSVPNLVPLVGAKAQILTTEDVPVMTEISDVRTMTLTLTANNPSYVTSSTAAGAVQRAPGNIDATLSISVYEGKWQDLLSVNDIRQLRMWVNATEFWDLKYMILQDLADLDVDIEGGGLMAATMNFALAAHTPADVGPVPTTGEIIKPDLVVWWP